MSKRAPEQYSIDQLTARVEALELENRHLRNRVVVLEEAEDKKRQKSPPRPSLACARQLSSAGRNTNTNKVPRNRRDKHGNRIDKGDRVYLVTRGRHSSRREVVTSITDTYVYVNDEDRIEQYRIAKNISIEHKYYDGDED